MRNNKLTIAVTAMATLAVLAFSACHRMKKDDNEDTGYALDHATLEKSFADAQSIADEAGTTGSLTTYKMAGGSVLSTCATVTNDTLSTPHKLTISFGATNCLCNDGQYRRGEIIISYTGRYREIGHEHTITFNNYFVNDNQLTGSKTVNYDHVDGNGNPVYDINVNGQVILANGNGTISWTSTRTRTWLSGDDTPTWSDDVYEIDGSGTVTRANGNKFDVDVTTPLHVALNCRWIESGVVNITPDGGSTRTIDYGNGTCDAQANVTVNGKTYSVTLRQ